MPTTENSQSHEPGPETPPAIIETDRMGVILRLMTTIDDDLEYVQFENRNAEHIAEFGNTVDATLDEATARRVNRHIVCFGIREDERLVGVVEYVPDFEQMEAEVGVLLDKDATGRGLASSALRTMTAYLEPRFDLIFAEIDPRNERSLLLFERAGYVRRPGLVERDWGLAVVMEYVRPATLSRLPLNLIGCYLQDKVNTAE